MVHDNEQAVKSPTYYFTREQLHDVLLAAIEGQQQYLAEHGLDAEGAARAGVDVTLGWLDADQQRAYNGEAHVLQLPAPADLLQQRDAARAEVARFQAESIGRYAFHFRHYAISYVRKANPDLFEAACNHAYARMNEQALAYEDVVERLEAQVVALRSAGHQAAQALHEVHDLLEQIPVVGAQPLGRFRWHQEIGPAAIAALEKAGVVQ